MNALLTKRIILLLHLIALVLYRIYGYTGHFGFDDMEYAQMAYELSQGNFVADNHFSYRLAIIIPTAISYLLFGLNDWASSIPSMIASALILLLVYQWVKRQQLVTISLALSFTLFTEWFLFYGNKLMVDIHVCLAFTAVIYVYYHLRFIQSRSQSFYAAAFAMGMFYGFNSKGTIILLLPLLLFFFTVDLFQKRNQVFWKQTVLMSGSLLLLYLLGSKAVTGDYFSRFDAIMGNSYLNKCSYAEQPLKIIFYRIAVDFWKMIRIDGFALVSLIALSPLLSWKAMERFKLKDPLSFLVSASFILLLSSNFMSISPFQYNPMCLDFRHYLYIVPIASAAAAIILGNWKNYRLIDVQLILLLALLLLSYTLMEDKYFYQLYLPAMLTLLIYSVLRRSDYLKSSNMLLLLTPLLLIQPIQMLQSANQVKYNEQRKIVCEQLLHADGSKVILSDQVQRNFGRYWDGFKEEKNTFLSFDEYKDGIQTVDYILLNPYTQFYAGISEADLPLTIQYLIENGNHVYHSDQPRMDLIKLDSRSSQPLQAKALFDTENLYAAAQEGWYFNEEALISEEGNTYEKVWEYSSTYRFNLDSIALDSNQHIRLQVSMKTKFLEKTKASIVASVVTSDTTLFWEGRAVNGFQRAFGNWWKVETAFKIPISKEFQQAELVVYLWNIDKQDAHIDDFTIKAIQF